MRAGGREHQGRRVLCVAQQFRARDTDSCTDNQTGRQVGHPARAYEELGPGLAITHYGNARSDPNYLTAWADAWNVIVPLLQSGAIKPIVAKTFPLAEAADALRYLVEGRLFGRVVLTI